MSTSTPAPSRKLFVNLAVTDLDRTMAYWQGLGFAFNRQFTDDKAACMVLSEEAYVMWLRRDFFATFTTRQICDTSQATESLLCLSADSREAVNALIEKAIATGGKPAMPAQDHGFMYGSSFYDVDGHHWEVMWMDPAVVQK